MPTNDKLEHSKFGLIEIMLLFGCLGILEMIMVEVFWEIVVYNDEFKIFREQQLISKISLVAAVFGLIGFYNVVVGLFTDALRKRKIRNYLATFYALEFVFVSYLIATGH